MPTSFIRTRQDSRGMQALHCIVYCVCRFI